jgi:hypothetical protein
MPAFKQWPGAIETCWPRHAKKSLAKGGSVHVPTFAGGITPQKSGRFSVRPSCPQLCKLSTDHRLLFTLDSGEEQLHEALGIDHRGDVCIRSDPFGACCHVAIAFGKRAQFVPAYFP